MSEHIPRCFFCGREIEYSGETKVTTEKATYEFECWECHECKKRYLIEDMGEDEE